LATLVASAALSACKAKPWCSPARPSPPPSSFSTSGSTFAESSTVVSGLSGVVVLEELERVALVVVRLVDELLDRESSWTGPAPPDEPLPPFVPPLEPEPPDSPDQLPDVELELLELEPNEDEELDDELQLEALELDDEPELEGLELELEDELAPATVTLRVAWLWPP
jgi:hypothetical protein